MHLLLWYLLTLQPDTSRVFTFAETDPVFGYGAAEDWFRQKIKNKDSCRGKILVRFILEKDGSVSHFQCVDCTPSAARGFTRVANTMPRWKRPAMNRQKPVRLQVSFFVAT